MSLAPAMEGYGCVLICEWSAQVLCDPLAAPAAAQSSASVVKDVRETLLSSKFFSYVWSGEF